MFKKFTEKDVSNIMQLKGSVQKQIKAKILEFYPDMDPYIDLVFPKKEPVKLVKCHNHIEILVSGAGSALFFRLREGAWFPTLRLLHQYPFMLAQERIDKAVIPYILGGANVMVPGLLARTATVCDVPKNTIVAIMATEKDHALGIGVTTMSVPEMVKQGRGVGVEVTHYLNDGLWTIKNFK